MILAAENLVLGNAPYRLLILQDITERIRLETELRQSQKMESVGRLAAGVAHDFNNILTVILGNASLELCKEGLDSELSASLHEVVLAAERATALTRQLLAYSRKQIIQRRPLGLNAMLEQSVATLRWLIGTHIAVDLRLAPGLPPIFADANSLDQVVMNLALNARDAMGEGGSLTFTTSFAELDDAGRARHPGTEAQRFGCLAVQDTGHGMDAATLAHIFELFFTTKDPGKGTGMGLATVYGILSRHAGWVDVESGPGCGTILLVEDENALREFVSRALGQLGYRVLSATNGQGALEVWAAHRDEIDLLLTDVVMPDSISGRQLAHRLVLDRPDLKVILTSGHSTKLIETDFERQNEHVFLPKPYGASHLAKTIAAQFPTGRPNDSRSPAPALAQKRAV